MAVGAGGQQELLTVRLDGDARLRVVVLEGELDLATSPSLVETLDLAVADRPEVLLVDVRNLSFMDSSGLRALLETREACRTIGCRLLLMRGSRAVERLLEVSGLSDFFDFVSDPLETANGG